MERERDEEVLAFEAHLTDVQDCASNTVASYTRETERFGTFLKARGKTYLEAERQDFIDFKESEKGGRKASSLSCTFKVLRIFYCWLEDEGRIEQYPIPRRMKIRVKRQDPEGIPTMEQFLHVRAELDKPVLDKRAVPQDLRRLIVEVLAGSGLRISALLTLCPMHLRFGDRPAVVVDPETMECKGKTAGEIPITPYAADLLKAYLQDHPGSFGKPIVQVSDWAVRSILKQVSPEGVNLHPHSLRHFYCTAMYFRDLDGGRHDSTWVRDAAGHSNIAITDRYLKHTRRICREDATWEAWAYGKAIAKEARSA